MELPRREASHASAQLPPPERHVPDEPSGEDEWNQEEDRLRDEEREQREAPRERERDADHGEAQAAHLPHQSPVLVGRDLPGVPPTRTLLALPPLTVRDA